jgi:PERQ amino acid-rich with GYF domain-containing protein
MSQLNNSDDMTLVDFLLGLPSAGEVQEYVALYLGKTPQANAFATELIRQKRADPSLASGLGNSEMAKVAAQTGGSGAAGGFTDDVDNDAGWSSASKKKGR